MGVNGAEPRRPRRIATADRESGVVPFYAVPQAQRERFRRFVDVAAPALNVESPVAECKAGMGSPRQHPPHMQPKLPARKSDPLYEAPQTKVVAEKVQVPFIPTAPRLDPEPSVMADSGWEHSLAKLIRNLSSSADPSFTQWTVQIPLDPIILPDTTLHIALSSCHLMLRFNTQSAWSQRLIFAATGTLSQSLQEALPHVQDIDIDIT
jgi:Type III secretion protein (HpaP)